MSYVRWSDNHYQCDLYTYAHVQGGVTIHVAGARRNLKETPPELPEMDINDPRWGDKWLEWYKTYNAVIDDADITSINLPYAGETFHFGDKTECVTFIAHLAELGYRFPTDLGETIAADWTE